MALARAEHHHRARARPARLRAGRLRRRRAAPRDRDRARARHPAGGHPAGAVDVLGVGHAVERSPPRSRPHRARAADSNTDAAWAARQFDDMSGRRWRRGLPQVGAPVVRRAVDMRYLGQIHTVTVELPDTAMWDRAPRPVRRRAQARLRLRGGRRAGGADQPAPDPRGADRAEPPARAGAGGGGAGVGDAPRSTPGEPRVRPRIAWSSATTCGAGHVIEGPAAVEEAGTTTLVEAGDVLDRGEHGCLVISRWDRARRRDEHDDRRAGGSDHRRGDPRRVERGGRAHADHHDQDRLQPHHQREPGLRLRDLRRRRADDRPGRGPAGLPGPPRLSRSRRRSATAASRRSARATSSSTTTPTRATATT